MTTTTDPSPAELNAEMEALEARHRVSQLIVSFVLAHPGAGPPADGVPAAHEAPRG